MTRNINVQVATPQTTKRADRLHDLPVHGKLRRHDKCQNKVEPARKRHAGWASMVHFFDNREAQAARQAIEEALIERANPDVPDPAEQAMFSEDLYRYEEDLFTRGYNEELAENESAEDDLYSDDYIDWYDDEPEPYPSTNREIIDDDINDWWWERSDRATRELVRPLPLPDPGLFSLRNHPPTDEERYMAVPIQADYNLLEEQPGDWHNLDY